MSSSEEFKQAIKAGNIDEAFLVAMSNAPKLSITTKIVTAKRERVDPQSSEVDNYLRTQINLIEGKVENEIGAKLTGDRYSQIQQFHTEQVTQGYQTIQHNLVSLQKMFQLMSSFQQQQNCDRSSWVDMAANVTRESLSSSDKGQFYGDRTTNALKAGAIPHQTKAETSKDLITSAKVNDPEPQLPSSEAEDDGIVNDLLSLSDIDDDSSAPTPETQTDWSDWLDDVPDFQAEVVELKSLKIQDAATIWQNWESENEAVEIEEE